jgi:hypothetical protein
MKKFTISITTTAAVLALAACGNGADEGNNTGNNPAGENNQNEEVNEEPDVNLAEDNEENNTETDDLDTDNDNGMNTDNDEMNDEMNDEEETEAVLDQDIQDFNLDVTLVDDTEWNFSYTPAENEDEQPDASISGDDLDLEGEEGAEEMETYLSNFNIDAASDEQEILSEVADTFDFNEDDISSYDLTVDFPEQDNAVEWSWDEEEENGEDNNDAEMNDDAENNG